MDINNLEGQIFNNFKLYTKIGRGSFGVVYEVLHVKNHKKYAIKIQSNKALSPQINFEYDAYLYLNLCFRELDKDIIPIPNVHGIFSNKEFTFVVMDLLGKSLYDVFRENNRLLQPIKAINYAKKMLDIIRTIHRAQIIYRDIKPENFVFTKDNQQELKLVDFGLCKKIPPFGERSKVKQTSNFIGTSRYASINAHQGKILSRKDDIESLVYVLIYLLKGSLPWQGIKANNEKEKNSLVLKMKKTISASQLCDDLPFELQKLVNYVRNEDCFDKVLNYDYLEECLNMSLQEIRLAEQKTEDKARWSLEQEFDLKNVKFESLKLQIDYPSINLLNLSQNSEIKKPNQTQTFNEYKQDLAIVKKKPIKRPQIKKNFTMNEQSNSSAQSQHQIENKHSKFMD